MKLYAPEYYKKFRCIADKCTHSCCIGWEIDIDDKTLEKYKSFNDVFGDTIIKSIEFEETPHFKLDINERCPHLNDCGLCNIILNKGEEYLCDICREHPRFYNNTPLGKEVGLGMVCEEAARLILSSDFNGKTLCIGEIEEKDEAVDFDAIQYRDILFEILSDCSLEYNEKLDGIYKKFEISPFNISEETWLELISSLEYLDEKHKKLFMIYSHSSKITKDQSVYLSRMLSYLIFRHCTDVFDEEDFICSLGFCLFCERLFASLLSAHNVSELSDVIKLASTLSEEIEYSEDNTEAIKLKFLS